jgi:tricarballylate dehydrogenase
VEERGGNTRYTGAYFRMKSPTEISDDFEEHFAANSAEYVDPTLLGELSKSPESWSPTLRAYGLVDPNVVATLAEQAPATLAWMGEFGVKYIPLDVPFPTSEQPRIVPSGGGLALIDALAARLEELGGTIVYNTAAQHLLTSEEGRITGVQAQGEKHRVVRFIAPSVVLASGGFQGNPEMMTRYIGPGAAYVRAMSLGCNFNKGEGIQMALDIGAATCGDFGSFHASPMDPRSNRAGPSMYVYPYGILINREGRRFVNEGPGHTDETYEDVTRHIAAQSKGLAWCILDAKVADLPNLAVAIRTEQPAVEAPTLEQLAAQIGVPGEVLQRTVNDYNAACRLGDFNPRDLDGLSTVGLTPPKSNWARPLDKGPYKAYPIISSIVFTFGGLKVNTRSQVVNREGDPIPGLYAAGETMGLYYGSYTGATSVLKGAVFGRIAGSDAAACAVGTAA